MISGFVKYLFLSSALNYVFVFDAHRDWQQQKDKIASLIHF